MLGVMAQNKMGNANLKMQNLTKKTQESKVNGTFDFFTLQSSPR